MRHWHDNTMTRVTAHILDDVARQFGMSDWSWQEGDVVTLAFDQSGTIYIEPQESCWLMYCAREGVPFEDRQAIHLLEACHPRHQEVGMTAGYLGEDCRVIVARVPLSALDVSRAVAVIDRLRELQGRA